MLPHGIDATTIDRAPSTAALLFVTVILSVLDSVTMALTSFALGALTTKMLALTAAVDVAAIARAVDAELTAALAADEHQPYAQSS
jgi:hypothetical protein